MGQAHGDAGVSHGSGYRTLLATDGEQLFVFSGASGFGFSHFSISIVLKVFQAAYRQKNAGMMSTNHIYTMVMPGKIMA
jgi:hypothetical protein